MSIYPQAIQRPGPLEKMGYPDMAINARRGVVCHSMVGYFAGAMRELDKLERRASWHFSVLQSGAVYQHAPTTAVTWHAGSKQANGLYIGIEHEGGYSPTDQPLTPVQRDASVALVRWLSLECGFPLERGVGLWEHRELAPPSDPTSCPSGRIPWNYYTEEDDMAIELVWDKTNQRLFVLGQGDPRWVADAAAAAELRAVFGQEKRALSWAALQALGAK